MRNKKASIGQFVHFKRASYDVLGYVTIFLENSVIVKIDSDIAEKLHYETNLTLVNNNKYKIIDKNGTVA
ncbi:MULTISPECIES: DUF2187 family protein [Niallia]|uniref:DUF2187 family protein n=1 Tax=Niallia TaxID=2837506 RepID=UPI0015F3EC0C|nr:MULTISPECIES: DUF2187 family protein [Niallia]UPO91229.1 YkvS family protein [Niallia sp. Man26]GKU85115.1 hypothetical protein NCCP28_45110 [Niallia sp. NCCP-28]